MKKWIVFTTLGIVLLGATAYMLFWRVSSRASETVARWMSDRLQTVVEVGEVKLSLKGIKIKELKIHNPPGFHLPLALAAQHLQIKTSLLRLVRSPVEIELVQLRDVYLSLEFLSPRGKEGNWATLLASSKEPTTSSTPSRSFRIDRLVLGPIQAEVCYQQKKKVRSLPPIPKIELFNLQGGGDDLAKALMNSALGEAVKQVFIEENLQDLWQQLLESPTAPLQQLWEPLKNFLNSLFSPAENCVAPRIEYPLS